MSNGEWIARSSAHKIKVRQASPRRKEKTQTRHLNGGVRPLGFFLDEKNHFSILCFSF